MTTTNERQVGAQSVWLTKRDGAVRRLLLPLMAIDAIAARRIQVSIGQPALTPRRAVAARGKRLLAISWQVRPYSRWGWAACHSCGIGGRALVDSSATCMGWTNGMHTVRIGFCRWRRTASATLLWGAHELVQRIATGLGTVIGVMAETAVKSLRGQAGIQSYRVGWRTVARRKTSARADPTR